jgi:hypothetical protein
MVHFKDIALRGKSDHAFIFSTKKFPNGEFLGEYAYQFS